MAITATFGADFSGFVSETKKAEVSLDSLEGRGQKLSQTFTAAETTSDRLRGSLQKFDGVLGSLGFSIGPQIRAIDEIGDAAGKTATEIGAIGTAGLVVGAGVAGWQLGRMIADFFKLDETISDATAAVFGFGSASAEAAEAGADVLIKASQTAGHTITDLTTAMRINQEASDRRIAKIKANAAEEQKIYDDALARNREDNAEFIRGRAARTAAEDASFKAFQTAMAELSLTGQHWIETLDTIDGEVVEGSKHYLDQGVSLKTLADAYHLTELQVRAVAAARKDEAEATEFANDALERQKEIVAITTRATNEAVIAKLKQKQADDAFLDTQLKEATAQDAVNLRIGQVPAVAGAAAASVNALANSYWAAIDAAAALAGIPDIGHRPPSIMDPDWPRPGSPGFGIGDGGLHPLRAMGGPVSAGRGYVVGERGPELFVPGISGTVVPNGVGGNVTVNFYDAFLDTPAGAQRTASRLGSAVLSTISGQGRPIG